VTNACNNFFIIIAEKLNIQHIEKGDDISILKDPFPGNFPSIKIMPNIEAEINSIIHSLKPKISLCYNEITTKILKSCASLISHPLSYIYNHSLYIDIFPSHLKIAVVKPLYKKGDKTTMTNYRPTSLLTVFSKVLEKAMH